MPEVFLCSFSQLGRNSMKNALERVWQSLVSGEEGDVEEGREEDRVEREEDRMEREEDRVEREEDREENRVEREEEAESSKKTHVPLTPLHPRPSARYLN